MIENPDTVTDEISDSLKTKFCISFNSIVFVSDNNPTTACCKSFNNIKKQKNRMNGNFPFPLFISKKNTVVFLMDSNPSIACRKSCNSIMIFSAFIY